MSGTSRQFSLCDYIVDTATQQTLDCIFAMISNPQIEFYDIILLHSSSNYTVVLRYGVNGSDVKHISNDENSQAISQDRYMQRGRTGFKVA